MHNVLKLPAGKSGLYSEPDSLRTIGEYMFASASARENLKFKVTREIGLRLLRITEGFPRDLLTYRS